MEVWGVGSNKDIQKGLDGRAAELGVRAANVRKAKTVDRAAFLEDFQSGAYGSKIQIHPKFFAFTMTNPLVQNLF